MAARRVHREIKENLENLAATPLVLTTSLALDANGSDRAEWLYLRNAIPLYRFV
jgi:hypothetical protein